VNAGEVVLLLGPEPVPNSRTMLRGSLYARIGAIEGKIQNVTARRLERSRGFKVSAPKLSQANIGGVAINEAGETLGIVDGLEGNEASILPAA
jgi:hypothetical protein